MGSPCPGGLSGALCLGVLVQGVSVQGGVSVQEVSLSRASLSKGEGLCPGGSLFKGDLCLEVPIQGGSLSRGSPLQRPHRQRPPRRNMGPVNQTGNDIIQRPLTRGQAPAKTLLCPITTTVCSRSVADPRGAPGMRAPLGVQILSISCSFWENMAKSYVSAPLGS